MRFIGIIPARYNSTRFPGKPLAKIDDKPMIQHVYESAKEALKEVYVATDDKRIFDVVQEFGGMAILTSADCRNGTERCAEAVRRFHLVDPQNTVIVNIQGDEPMVSSKSIENLLAYFENETVKIATLVCSLPPEERDDINTVKVAVSPAIEKGLWCGQFSREYIPSHVNYKHVGVYGYKASTLVQLTNLKIPCNLEQISWVFAGYEIICAQASEVSFSVNTPEDIVKVESYLSQGKLKQIFLTESEAVKTIPIDSSYTDAINIIMESVHRRGAKVITSGMGKAGQIAHTIATTFSSTGTPAVFLHPSEAQHGDLGVIQDDDILLLVSNSGETREVLELLDLAGKRFPDIQVISITGNNQSTLWGRTNVNLYTGCPDEVCPLGLTPTTSTTVMSVIGDALVVLMMNKINFTKEEYAKRHHGGYIGKQLKNG